MPIFEAGDVIKVPFPFLEKPVRRYRPALVVSSSELQKLHGLLWVLMIAKIATIEATEASRIGTLGHGEFKLVTNMLNRALGR
jgi:hypothetical protein